MESKRRGNETSVGITGGFDGKALDLKLGNRQRYTGGLKLQKQLLLLSAMGDNAGQTGKKQCLWLGGQQGRAPCMTHAEQLLGLQMGRKPDVPFVKLPEHTCPGFQAV